MSFHTSICVPVDEKKLAVLLRFAVRDIAPAMSHFLLDVVAHRPPAATTIASTLLRTRTAVVLSRSLAYFNCQVFLTDPLNRSLAKRSKTAEVVENISCERTLFPDSHFCKLCVIPGSRVLRSVCSILNGDLQFWRSSYQTNSPPIVSSWNQVSPPSLTTSVAATSSLGVMPVCDRRPFRPPAKPLVDHIDQINQQISDSFRHEMLCKIST